MDIKNLTEDEQHDYDLGIAYRAMVDTAGWKLLEAEMREGVEGEKAFVFDNAPKDLNSYLAIHFEKKGRVNAIEHIIKQVYNVINNASNIEKNDKEGGTDG